MCVGCSSLRVADFTRSGAPAGCFLEPATAGHGLLLANGREVITPSCGRLFVSRVLPPAAQRVIDPSTTFSVKKHSKPAAATKSHRNPRSGANESKPKPRRSHRGRAPSTVARHRNASPEAKNEPGHQPVAVDFILYTNPTLTLVCLPPKAPALFSLAFAADLTGVHQEMLRYYCRLGLLGEARTGMEDEPTFDEEALQEVRRIEHYRRHLALRRCALPLICNLRREAERQHIDIHFLHGP